MAHPNNKAIPASVTSRGQVTLPAEVRRLLGIAEGEKVLFVIEDGQVSLRKPRFTLKSVGGSVPPLTKKLTWKQMTEIAHEELVERYIEKSAREAEGRQ